MQAQNLLQALMSNQNYSSQYGTYRQGRYNPQAAYNNCYYGAQNVPDSISQSQPASGKMPVNQPDNTHHYYSHPPGFHPQYNSGVAGRVRKNSYEPNQHHSKSNIPVAFEF